MKKYMKGIIVALIGIVIFTLLFGNFFWSNALLKAVEKQQTGIVKALTGIKIYDINKPAEVGFPLALIYDMDQYTPLQAACATGNYSVVAKLISSGAKINTKWVSDIGLAEVALCKYDKGDRDIIEALINEGANFSKGGVYFDSVLMYAARTIANNKEEEKRITDVYRVVEEEYSGEKLLDENNNSPLFFAVAAENVELVKYLVRSKNIKINQQNKDGETALFWLCMNEKKEMVRLQAAEGGAITYEEIDVKNSDSVTEKQLEIVEILLSNGL
ncbi:MAG: ankyrin repeat domain-containing protein, partial [Anaerovoracaceae bacterium]